MGTYLNVVQIIISIVLIVLVLIQAQNRGGGVGGVFGGQSSVYQSRRGVEKTIFNLTIVFSVLFLVVAIINVVLS